MIPFMSWSRYPFFDIAFWAIYGQNRLAYVRIKHFLWIWDRQITIFSWSLIKGGKNTKRLSYLRKYGRPDNYYAGPNLVDAILIYFPWGLTKMNYFKSSAASLACGLLLFYLNIYVQCIQHTMHRIVYYTYFQNT